MNSRKTYIQTEFRRLSPQKTPLLGYTARLARPVTKGLQGHDELLTLGRLRGSAPTHALMECVALPAALVSVTGRVVLLNALAQQLEVRHAPLILRRREVITGPQAWKLLPVLQAAITPTQTTPLLVHLQQSGALDWYVSVRALHNPFSLHTPLLLVSISAPYRFGPPLDSVLQSLFLLTPCEARVARMLANGDTLATIAAHTNVTVDTVRSHLRVVFAKTGTCRQAAVSLLISQISLLAPGYCMDNR